MCQGTGCGSKDMNFKKPALLPLAGGRSEGWLETRTEAISASKVGTCLQQAVAVDGEEDVCSGQVEEASEASAGGSLWSQGTQRPQASGLRWN